MMTDNTQARLISLAILVVAGTVMVVGGGALSTLVGLGLLVVCGAGYLREYQRTFKLDRYNETRCRQCGHILRGISEPRCPECGERI